MQLPFALRPGMPQKVVERTKEISKEIVTKESTKKGSSTPYIPSVEKQRLSLTLRSRPLGLLPPLPSYLSPLPAFPPRRLIRFVSLSRS